MGWGFWHHVAHDLDRSIERGNRRRAAREEEYLYSDDFERRKKRQILEWLAGEYDLRIKLIYGDIAFEDTFSIIAPDESVYNLRTNIISYIDRDTTGLTEDEVIFALSDISREMMFETHSGPTRLKAGYSKNESYGSAILIKTDADGKYFVDLRKRFDAGYEAMVQREEQEEFNRRTEI